MPWPISVQQWRTSTVPSSSNRTTAPAISLNPLPRPEFLIPMPEPDGLAGGAGLVVDRLDGVEAHAGAQAPVVHDLSGSPHDSG